MKVICTDSGYISLTYGKEYEILGCNFDDRTFTLKDNDGDVSEYPVRDFELLLTEKDSNKTETPCMKLGHKVGDKFLVNAGTEKGCIIELYEDDGTDIPNFIRPNGDTFYKSLSGVTPLGVPLPVGEAKITYKTFLEGMPKASGAGIYLAKNGVVYIYAHGSEFVCTSEQRVEEVCAALLTLFKE